MAENNRKIEEAQRKLVSKSFPFEFLFFSHHVDYVFRHSF